MGMKILAPRSGETMELKSIVILVSHYTFSLFVALHKSVLVAHQRALCLRIVLPSKPSHFRMALKREKGKIRQMAARYLSNYIILDVDVRWQHLTCSQTRRATICDKDNIDFSSTISPLRDASISGLVAARVFKRASFQNGKKKLESRKNFLFSIVNNQSEKMIVIDPLYVNINSCYNFLLNLVIHLLKGVNFHRPMNRSNFHLQDKGINFYNCIFILIFLLTFHSYIT